MIRCERRVTNVLRRRTAALPRSAAYYDALLRIIAPVRELRRNKPYTLTWWCYQGGVRNPNYSKPTAYCDILVETTRNQTSVNLGIRIIVCNYHPWWILVIEINGNRNQVYCKQHNHQYAICIITFDIIIFHNIRLNISNNDTSLISASILKFLVIL